MASTKQTIAEVEANLLESMGQRAQHREHSLSPVPHPRDFGRRPVRGFGKVAVDQVMPDPEQPRTEFSSEAVDRLAASIRDKGQLSPIRVRWSDEHRKWIIVAGERRWRATCAAGLETIECFFHEGELSDSEILEQQLIENLLREELNPMEEARAYARLMEVNGWNGKQVAEALHIPTSKVSRCLAMLKLPKEVQQLVAESKVSARSAYELSKITDVDRVTRLAQQACEGKLTHEQAAAVAKQAGRRSKPRPRGHKLTFTSDLPWQVVVTSKAGRNYHEVEQALEEALAEVRHRIRNNVQLL